MVNLSERKQVFYFHDTCILKSVKLTLLCLTPNTFFKSLCAPIISVCKMNHEPDSTYCTACTTGSIQPTVANASCYCNVSYEPNPSGGSPLCQACPAGSHKTVTGNTNCTCDAQYEPNGLGDCLACGTCRVKPLAGDHACVCDTDCR